MKFGKTLQQQIFAQNGFPGWSSFFCDYKGLKKVRPSPMRSLPLCANSSLTRTTHHRSSTRSPRADPPTPPSSPPASDLPDPTPPSSSPSRRRRPRPSSSRTPRPPTAASSARARRRSSRRTRPPSSSSSNASSKRCAAPSPSPALLLSTFSLTLAPSHVADQRLLLPARERPQGPPAHPHRQAQAPHGVALRAQRQGQGAQSRQQQLWRPVRGLPQL